MAVLAVDIGGTKVALALVTPEDSVVAKEVYPSSPDHPEITLEHMVSFARERTFDAVGVCVPAVLDHEDQLLWLPNLPGWDGYPLRERLQTALDCPVVVEYDGHAAALGEWRAGAARGYQSVASVVIGTGIGGGIVADGKVWRGRDRLAGAVGWFPMTGPDGLEHWENLASGPAILRRFRKLASHRGSSLTPDTATTPDIFAAAQQGDPLAREVVNEAAGYIGYGVATIVSLMNPDIVVLGGSVGQQGDLLEPVRATVQRWAQPISAKDIPIASSPLGEDANLLGVSYAVQSRLKAL